MNWINWKFQTIHHISKWFCIIHPNIDRWILSNSINKLLATSAREILPIKKSGSCANPNSPNLIYYLNLSFSPSPVLLPCQLPRWSFKMTRLLLSLVFVTCSFSASIFLSFCLHSALISPLLSHSHFDVPSIPSSTPTQTSHSGKLSHPPFHHTKFWSQFLLLKPLPSIILFSMVWSCLSPDQGLCVNLLLFLSPLHIVGSHYCRRKNYWKKNFIFTC